MMEFLFYLFCYESIKFTYVPSKHEKIKSSFAAESSYVLSKSSYFMKKLNNLLSEF